MGTVQALRSDTIVVDRGEILVLALSSLTRLEVSRGQKSRAGTGGIVGFVGGAVAGAVIAAASMEDRECDFWSADDCLTLSNEDLGALTGATVLARELCPSPSGGRSPRSIPT